MRSGLPTSSPPPSQRLIVSFSRSPPADNISMWTWEDYRWFVTGEAGHGAAFRWSHRLSSGFDWWSLRAAARGRLTLERWWKSEGGGALMGRGMEGRGVNGEGVKGRGMEGQGVKGRGMKGGLMGGAWRGGE